MNKFGLFEEEERPVEATFSDRLAAFPRVAPRQAVDLDAVDAAAAQHGFVSREATEALLPGPSRRRRRAIPSEPSRHLAIRLTASAYDRFVAYADRYQLTYHDALARLMDRAGE